MADDIIEIFENGLILRMVENGINETKATGIVSGYFSEQRENYYGERYFIKRGYQKYPPSIIKKIKREYNGSNAEFLRERYGISRTHFYRAILK